MINLRQSERIQSRSILRYWTKDRSMMISQANDVSDTGISFNTGRMYKKGTPVYIQMRTPAQGEELITFKAKVTHQEKNFRNDLYKTGAEIVNFHSGDSNRLKGYIDFMKSYLQ